MLSDQPMIGLNQFYLPLRRLPWNRQLLNLLAARYLVARNRLRVSSSRALSR